MFAKNPQFYPYKSFENLDPFEIGYECYLISGDKRISVYHECELKNAEVIDDEIRLTFERTYTTHPDINYLVPMRGRIVLRFMGAKMEPNPVNEPEHTFEEMIDVSNLLPIDVPEELKQKGYQLGIEVDGGQDGY